MKPTYLITFALVALCAMPLEAAVRVSACSVEEGAVVERFESFGRLTSARTPTLSSEVDGRLQQVSADAGDEVAAGELLAQIDRRDLELERDAQAAEVTRLQAQLANEERRMRRFSNLKKDDYLAQTQLEDTQAQIAVLRAQLEGAEARLGQATDKLARSAIRAPFAGVVEARLVAEGDFVTRGKALFQLVDNHRLRAELPVPETLAHRIHQGQPITLRTPLAPELAVTAKVAAILPRVGEVSRAVTVVAEFANPGPLRAGATAIGAITLATREGTLLVPQGALVRRPAGETLYRIVDGQARAVVVTPGERQNGRVEVRGALGAGETIACDGAGFLSDGVEVEVEVAATEAAQ